MAKRTRKKKVSLSTVSPAKALAAKSKLKASLAKATDSGMSGKKKALIAGGLLVLGYACWRQSK